MLYITNISADIIRVGFATRNYQATFIYPPRTLWAIMLLMLLTMRERKNCTLARKQNCTPSGISDVHYCNRDRSVSYLSPR
jgi:hypothetical protein